MFVWFIVLFLIGVWRITFDPAILRAFNPWEAISYLIREKQYAFLQIGNNEDKNKTILSISFDYQISFFYRRSFSIGNRSRSTLC